MGLLHQEVVSVNGVFPCFRLPSRRRRRALMAAEKCVAHGEGV